jgi:short-subunit dehydrogenase
VDQFNPGVLICAVGTISFDQDKIHYDQFKREFEINFTANIVPIKAALPQMIRRRSGQIIVLSSTSGHHAPHTLASYGPSKWAIENFSSALAAEAKRFGITVDSISPTSIQNIHSQAFKIQGIPAQRVVKRIAKAIRRPKGAGHFVPAQYRLVRLLERLLPWFLNWRAGLALKRRAQFRGAPLESGLITGASSGLGRELALLYARKLKKIFLQGRNLKALEELRTKIHQSCPCEVELRTCDLSDPAQVDEFIKNFPPVDVLVNNGPRTDPTGLAGQFFLLCQADPTLSRARTATQKNHQYPFDDSDFWTLKFECLFSEQGGPLVLDPFYSPTFWK